MSDETTELLHVGDILFNEPCDERIVVIAANERNVWLRKVQKNDELAMHDGHVWAMLGKKCNVKNMCTQSYAQHVFELDGHVGQATSEMHGTLTAEQVREAIERHVKFYEGGDYDEQAIADELNAVLGGEICEMTRVGYAPDAYKCSLCGETTAMGRTPKACPQCGAKVVER